MRLMRIVSVTTITCALAGCEGVPQRMDGSALVAPPGAYLVDRRRNLEECDAEAKAGFSSGVRLSEEEKAPLQGRSTIKFYFEGHPAVNGELNPSWRESLMGELGGYAPPELSDRFVLCLLNRGYTWPHPAVRHGAKE